MKELKNDSRENKIRILEMLLRDNKETLRQQLNDGTIQEPNSKNKLSEKVERYYLQKENIKVLKALINKAKK